MEQAVRIDAVKPWRTATLVAGTVAVAELVALLVLGLGAVAEPVAEQAREVAKRKAFAPVAPVAAEPAKTPAGKAPKPLPRGETTVLVLNGNGRAGAAGDAGARVRARGYALGGVGNAPRSDYRRSLVMYRAGRAAEARRLAADLGVKVVAPLDGLRPEQLLGANLVLVLGAT